MLNEIIKNSLNISGNNLTEEQQFALIINANFEYFKYNLIDNSILKNLKNSFGEFEFKYKKNNIDYLLILKIIDDTKYNLIIESQNKKVTHEIKMEKFMNNVNLKNLNEKNLIPLNNKIKDYIQDYESGFINNNIDSDIKYLNNNNNNKPINLELNYDKKINFENLNENNFNHLNNLNNNNKFNNNNNNNNNNFMPKINGNLMGPESFNNMSNPINFNSNNNPYKIRYDPITPFGINYDFYPQQDGPIGPDNFNPEFNFYTGINKKNINFNNGNNNNPLQRSPFLNPNNPYANNEIPDDLHPFGTFNPNKPNNLFGGGNGFGGGNFGFI
jgi:hypothetical protein